MPNMFEIPPTIDIFAYLYLNGKALDRLQPVSKESMGKSSGLKGPVPTIQLLGYLQDYGTPPYIVQYDLRTIWVTNEH